jgi:hypothetical protein
MLSLLTQAMNRDQPKVVRAALSEVTVVRLPGPAVAALGTSDAPISLRKQFATGPRAPSTLATARIRTRRRPR